MQVNEPPGEVLDSSSVSIAKATIWGYLFAMAKTGNIAAIIFWAEDQVALAGSRRRRTSQLRMPMIDRVQRWSSFCPITAEIRS
jgi:hypothetical protein